MLNTLKAIRQSFSKLLIISYLKSKIQEKCSGLVGKRFDNEIAYGDSEKYMKTKTKTYKDKVKTFKVKKYQKKILYISVCHY